MKNDTLAILLNAFVMPGGGQILLGQKRKGTAIAALAVLFVTLPLIRYTHAVRAALEELSTRGPGLAAGLSALSKAWTTSWPFILACVAMLVVVWIYGIIDVVIVRQKDRPRSPP